MIPIGDTVQRRHVAWMTWTLIGLNVWVFLVELLMEPGQRLALMDRFALVPAAPQAKTLLTHMFLHQGVGHLLGNLWFLWLFGDDVEDRMGPFRFLAFYLLCGLAAAAMHIATYTDSYVPILGASGAIAGVMGAFWLMFPRARLYVLGMPFAKSASTSPAYLYLGLWFLLQFYLGWDADRRQVASGVAWWAHTGGFMTGCLLFYLFVRADRWNRRDPGYTE